MKIIDLLNKIANGEELPRSIFYQGEDFVFNFYENTYVCCDHDTTPLFNEYNMKKEKFLNDEVEITEEEPRDINVCGSWFTKSEYDELFCCEEEKKIPEKLDIRQEKNIKNNWKWKVYGKEHSYNISTPQKIIADKVNEIIDYLKSKGE